MLEHRKTFEVIMREDHCFLRQSIQSASTHSEAIIRSGRIRHNPHTLRLRTHHKHTLPDTDIDSDNNPTMNPSHNMGLMTQSQGLYTLHKIRV